MSEQMTKAQQVERAIMGQWRQLKSVVPEHVTPERLVRIAVSAISRNETLTRCSVASLVEAVTQAGIVGLEPNDGTGRAYILPYKGSAAFQIGYKGLLDLAYRSGLIDLVDAQVVYEGEGFECRLGTSPYLEHTPSFDHGPMRGVYAVVKIKGVEFPLIEMMGPSELARIKAASPGANRGDSAWKMWEEEQSRKSVLKRVLKRAPSSTEMRVALGVIDAEDRGVPVDDVFPGAFSGDGEGAKLTTPEAPAPSTIDPARNRAAVKTIATKGYSISTAQRLAGGRGPASWTLADLDEIRAWVKLGGPAFEDDPTDEQDPGADHVAPPPDDDDQPERQPGDDDPWAGGFPGEEVPR